MFCLNHKQDMKRRNFNHLNRSFWVNENMNDSRLYWTGATTLVLVLEPVAV